MNKTDFDTKLTSFHKRINSNKTRNLVPEKELKRLKIIDLSYFRGEFFFGNNVFQDMFVYQPTLNTLQIKYEKTFENVVSWKSKGTYTTNLKPLHGAFFS